MSSDPINLENPTDECTVCKKQVVKRFAKIHKATSNGDTSKRRRKFADETGRLWHGTKCPTCAANWRKDRAQKVSEEKQAELKKQLES